MLAVAAMVLIGVTAATGAAWLIHLDTSARARDGDPPDGDLIDRIDALLPQTQCGRCGYAGCRPYAAAIARREARINQCPPGGTATIRSLADLLGDEPLPLNPAYGREQAPQVVIIDEQTCIGCTKCIQACPVDAIVGAPKLMHTVIAAACTGCELCIPPCPVDCIAIVPLAAAARAWKWPRPEAQPA